MSEPVYEHYVQYTLRHVDAKYIGHRYIVAESS